MFVMYPVRFEGLDPCITTDVSKAVNTLVLEKEENLDENPIITDNDNKEYLNIDDMIKNLNNGGLLILKTENKPLFILEFIEPY